MTQPESGGKILLPLAFCRECGQEYLVVWRRQRNGAVHLQPPARRLYGGGESEDGPSTSPRATSTSPRTGRGHGTGRR